MRKAKEMRLPGTDWHQRNRAAVALVQVEAPQL
jgi:hypothetical protein